MAGTLSLKYHVFKGFRRWCLDFFVLRCTDHVYRALSISQHTYICSKLNTHTKKHVASIHHVLEHSDEPIKNKQSSC